MYIRCYKCSLTNTNKTKAYGIVYKSTDTDTVYIVYLRNYRAFCHTQWTEPISTLNVILHVNETTLHFSLSDFSYWKLRPSFSSKQRWTQPRDITQPLFVVYISNRFGWGGVPIQRRYSTPFVKKDTKLKLIRLLLGYIFILPIPHP